MLADLHPELQMHALAKELRELEPRGAPGFLQDLPLLADHDALLALALEPDQPVHDALAGLVLAEVLDPTVSPYGTSWCTSVMSFSRITSAIRNLRSRSVTVSFGNSAGPAGSR